jgi:hypothetical protein
MPEIPDFDQIARTIATPYAHAVQEPPDGLDDGGGAGFVLEVSPDEDDLTAAIAEQLRLVWNARGAADIAIVRTDLLCLSSRTNHDDPDNSGMCIYCSTVLDYDDQERFKYLADAFRTLDR